jgi:hypothetical protein
MSIDLAPRKTIAASAGSAEESAITVRCRALMSPALNRRMSALQLGLTDPHGQVRLVAASQMAQLLESRFDEGGLAPVVAWLTESIMEPRLFFRARDPRLQSFESFDPHKATHNARLSGLMVVQSVMQNSDSRLRIPLATYFREQGLFENLKAARENSRFLDLCLRSGLKFPPFNLEHGGAMEYLMHSFKYAVAVAAYQNKELRGRFFPDISEQRSEPMAALSARMGILNALGQIGRSAVEGESDAAVARELGEELSAVVGVLFTLRLPRHATNR